MMTSNGTPSTETEKSLDQPTNLREENLPIVAEDIPILYEDEGQEEMGDSHPHSVTIDNIKPGLIAHLARQPQYGVYSDINTYYHRIDKWAYISADLMVVVPKQPLPANLTSYRIGVHGPAPVLVLEVLSRRSFQQQDLTNKPIIYSFLGVAEYVLVDVSGEFMPQRLLIKRLQDDGTWIDSQDNDGGITSRLGFRIVLDADGQVRVVDRQTGKRYLRLGEGQPTADALEAELRAQGRAAADALEKAQAELRAREERIRALEEELARLKGEQPEQKP